MTHRIVAVDWSGARHAAERKIWLAEAAPAGAPAVARLEDGRDRDAVAEHLIELAGRSTSLVVGLDFAFSLPAWFLEGQGLASAPALWDVVAREGERWLADCAPPFWGRAGTRRPERQEHYRRTEREVPRVGGIRAKSAFQLLGAGAVGTGSIRGMPVLRRLRAAGFAVWPFDAPARHVVVEIYPRLLTGAVRKRDAAARHAYLRRDHPRLDEPVHARAADCEDAFDAAVSVLAMARHRAALRALPAAADRIDRLEGRIWWPGPPAPPEVRGAARDARDAQPPT